MSHKIGIFGKVKGLEAYNHHPTPKRPRPSTINHSSSEAQVEC